MAVPAEITAAIIGAASALAVILIKDILLDGHRQKVEARKALVDRKLTELYTPLWVTLGGGANTLTSVLVDDIAYSKLNANFHLLTPELKEKFEKFMSLGRGNPRNPTFGADDMEIARTLLPEIAELLRAEIEKLRLEYEKE